MSPVLWRKQSTHLPHQCHCDLTGPGWPSGLVSATGRPGSLPELVAHISSPAAHEAASFPPSLSHPSGIPEAPLPFPSWQRLAFSTTIVQSQLSPCFNFVSVTLDL